jgi:hypothetical protein
MVLFSSHKWELIFDVSTEGEVKYMMANADKILRGGVELYVAACSSMQFLNLTQTMQNVWPASEFTFVSQQIAAWTRFVVVHNAALRIITPTDKYNTLYLFTIIL